MTPWSADYLSADTTAFASVIIDGPDFLVRATYDLLNALEFAEDKLPAAEALYAIYARNTHGFERSQFADWVSYRVRDGDLRFMDLNEKVWDWRLDEEEATHDLR